MMKVDYGAHYSYGVCVCVCLNFVCVCVTWLLTCSSLRQGLCVLISSLPNIPYPLPHHSTFWPVSHGSAPVEIET